MYMEAIKQSEDKGIMMGTTITIKLKGQSVIFFFFIFYYPSVSCFLLKNIFSFSSFLSLFMLSSLVTFTGEIADTKVVLPTAPQKEEEEELIDKQTRAVCEAV